jgi:hypothetical protein
MDAAQTTDMINPQAPEQSELATQTTLASGTAAGDSIVEVSLA